MMVATFGSALLGWALGRLGAASQRGRALVNLLTEARGALGPVLLFAMIATVGTMPPWLIVGAVVACLQGVAVARWILRTDADGTTVRGDYALGHSDRSLTTRSAAARGAVSSTIAYGVVLVAGLTALLDRAPNVALRVNDGGSSASTSAGAWLGVCVLLFSAEQGFGWLLRGGLSLARARLFRRARGRG